MRKRNARCACAAATPANSRKKLAIVFIIVTFLAAVARRINSRRAAQRIDFQAGVIGKREQTGIFRQAPRLFKRIGFERRTIFKHRGRICEIAQGTNSNRQIG